MTTYVSISVPRKDVRQIVDGTFPDYRGRKIKIEPKGQITFRGTNWCGGSRNEFRSCTLSGTPAGNLERETMRFPTHNRAEGATVDIPPGFVVVEHVIFCGKDLGLRIHCNPADMPKHLA